MASLKEAMTMRVGESRCAVYGVGGLKAQRIEESEWREYNTTSHDGNEELIRIGAKRWLWSKDHNYYIYVKGGQDD